MSCLCALTRLTARAITRVYESEFRTVGLQAPQFWLLMTLSRDEKELSQVQLLKDVAMDQTTLSRNLAVLVRRKWVKSEAKGRQRLYSLTLDGRAMLEQARPRWTRAQDRMREALGADWETVWNALNRLAAAAEST
jgi:DNA-binding MarR family transcriptional regulator